MEQKPSRTQEIEQAYQGMLESQEYKDMLKRVKEEEQRFSPTLEDLIRKMTGEVQRK